MNSGIYQIRNKINNYIYIGSAVSITERWTEHIRRLNKNKHHSRHLQSAWNKYGEENFEFSILEECEKEQLVEREQYYLDTLCPEYNVCKIAYSQLGMKHTPEAREKMSISRRGKICTAETRKKLSEKAKGRTFSQQWHELQSISHRGYKPT